MGEEFAELKIKDKIYKLPIKKASIGQDVIDVTKLYGQTGYFTYDPGFMSTASCTSSITYIDGDNGVLRHRGYDIKELAENKDFLEVAYLLLTACNNIFHKVFCNGDTTFANCLKPEKTRRQMQSKESRKA